MPAAVAAAMCTTPAVSGQRMLAASVVGGLADMASAIACLVGMEVVEGRFPAAGEGSVVTVAWVVAVVHVTIKALMPVEPRTGPDEYSTDKPVWSVIAVGGTVVGRIVEVAVGADGRAADLDRNLRWS